MQTQTLAQSAVHWPESTVYAVVLGGAFAAILAFALLMMIINSWRKVQQTRAREETRREVAAYVAEGTMTADEGAKLMAAGESIKSRLFGSEPGFCKVKIGAYHVDENGVRPVVAAAKDAL